MSLAVRKINVSFTLATGSFQESGTDTVKVEGLRISAKIVKVGGNSMGSADVTIWGLTLSLMNQLSTLGMRVQLIPRNVVTIEAGDDESGMSTVFIGTIVDAYADFQAQPQVSFRVTAKAGLGEAVAPATATSYKGTVSVATAMSDFANRMSLKFENSGVTTQLNNGYYSGSLRSQAYDVANHANINITIDNGVLAIWPKNGARNGSIPLIAPPPEGEMVGYPAYTTSGIMVSTLFNPSLSFGGKVQVKSSLPAACKTFTILSIAYDLDAQVPGGSWYTRVGCYDNEGPTPTVVTR